GGGGGGGGGGGTSQPGQNGAAGGAGLPGNPGDSGSVFVLSVAADSGTDGTPGLAGDAGNVGGNGADGGPSADAEDGGPGGAGGGAVFLRGCFIDGTILFNGGFVSVSGGDGLVKGGGGGAGGSISMRARTMSLHNGALLANGGDGDGEEGQRGRIAARARYIHHATAFMQALNGDGLANPGGAGSAGGVGGGGGAGAGVGGAGGAPGTGGTGGAGGWDLSTSLGGAGGLGGAQGAGGAGGWPGGCYRVYDSVTVREPGGRYVISPGFWTLDGEVIGQTFPEGDEVNGRGSKTDSTDLPFPPNDFHYYDDEYTDADGNTTRLKGNAVWSLLAPAADTGFPFNLYAPPGGGIIETDYHWNINLFDPPIDVRLNELPLYSGPLSGFMPADLGLVFIGTRGPEGCAFDFEPSRLVLGTLDGQHGFLSAGVDSFFDVFHTIGNPLGLPMNPEGGVQCVGAFSQPPGGPESRISRHTPCLTGRRDVSFDTGIQFFNPGSEPFTGWVILGVSLPDQTHIPGAAIGLYRLNPADPASPLAVFIRASSFDGDELISIIETPLPPESQWLRIRLGVDFDLNRLLDININALSTGEEVSMTLDDHFLAGGVSPMGPTTHFGLVVAPDGSYAMGFDNIRIEPLADRPTPCPADYNNDGGVDGADVEAFFADWEQGLPAADVNGDGGIDGADVEFFFAAWENGGCG
ncbi:MAG: hypothetical protein KF864_15645, partial [Phycisphaeraceae bacterium]|nr:hypothetical protein [Phycisphaeraceae bacterium]